MAPEPLVSVIIDNYNYDAYLPECIESALVQTYAPLEIIVVDDGSTDGSRSVIEGQGHRVRAIFQANAGQAAALNAGVRASRGSILCFLDADDRWLPQKLARVVGTFERHPDAMWLRHRLAVVDAGRRSLGAVTPGFRGSRLARPRPWQVIEGRLSVPTSALALRRELAERVFPLPLEVAARPGQPAIPLLHDADAVLAARAAATGAPCFSLDEVLGEYRRHPAQVFAGAADLARMLERQNAVATAAASCFVEILGHEVVASTVYKHEAICAASAGWPLWSQPRLGSALRGLRQCGRLFAADPLLGARQALALAFALLAPGTWTRKLMRTNGFPEGAPGPRSTPGRAV
jgi:glycosyltransferase involved in cell wall biosynthesis